MKLSFALFFASTSLILAQPIAPTQPSDAKPTKGAHGRVNPMDSLGLTPEQHAAMQPILKDSKAKATAIIANQGLQGPQKQEQLQALHAATQQQIASILNAEQQIKWQAMRDSRPGMGQPKDRMALTDEQKALAKPIMMNAKAKSDAIAANTSLTPEQKRQQMDALRDQTKQQMKAALMPQKNTPNAEPVK